MWALGHRALVGVFRECDWRGRDDLAVGVPGRQVQALPDFGRCDVVSLDFVEVEIENIPPLSEREVALVDNHSLLNVLNSSKDPGSSWAPLCRDG